MFTRKHLFAAASVLLALIIAAIPFTYVLAMISGGTGNEPLADPGWAKGAAVIFNNKARVAFWEGPPLGGGQFHAECRGDAATFNKVLDDFAKLNVKDKKVIVHDGVGKSVWLHGEDKDGKPVDSKVDWVFMIWNPKSFKEIRKMPRGLGEDLTGGKAGDPPSTIDVYAGGNIKWEDVKIPDGVKVDDQRLSAHGFTPEDGLVLEGRVIDIASQKPVAGKVTLELVEAKKTGGYDHKKVAETTSDAQGHWVVKKTPAGWLRIVISADGYVSRVAGYAQFDGQPKWESYNSGLARPAEVAGRIVDDKGAPLPDVEVRIHDLRIDGAGRYEPGDESPLKTDAEGKFATTVPVGKAQVWIHKPGYVRPGLGPEITTPKKDIELAMMKSSRVVVTVDFSRIKKPANYIVDMESDKGRVVGSWGGSGNINEKNQMIFENVPPGRYIFKGYPNPHGPKQETFPVALDLVSGETLEYTLVAAEEPLPEPVKPIKPPKPPTSTDQF